MCRKTLLTRSYTFLRSRDRPEQAGTDMCRQGPTGKDWTDRNRQGQTDLLDLQWTEGTDREKQGQKYVLLSPPDVANGWGLMVVMAVMTGGGHAFAALAEKNWTVLVKQELMQIQTGIGQIMKGGLLSYLTIKRSHVLNGHHVLLWALNPTVKQLTSLTIHLYISKWNINQCFWYEKV